jgi:ESX secretion system protein EccD
LASSVHAELSRVTIVAPATRVDLALPANVPLATLLPTLLRYAGEDLPDDPAAQSGWILTRLGGRVLDSGRTAAQLDIRDGEVLYFTPQVNAPEEMIFDDVVDAVATATQRRTGRWQADATRRFSVTFATLALLGGALAMFFSGASALTVGIVGLLAGTALIVAATVLARAFGDGRASVLLGLAALAYATVGGLLVLAGGRTWHSLAAPHVLTGATALVAFAAVATVATGEATGLFVGASGAGLALVVGASICLIFGVPAAAAGAVIAAVVFGLIPALPMFAYRLARLPVPSIPTRPDELKIDAESVDGLQILARSDRAEEILTGLTGTVALVLLGGELALAFTGGLPGLLLCTVLAVLLLLRARPLAGRRQRLTVLTAGTAGLALAVTAFVAATPPVVRVAVIPGVLLLVAVAALVYGLAVTGRRISPVWGRLLDIAEIVLIVSVVPLAAWVSGAYAWIRTLHP